MISLRNHIFTIIAIFLMLAIGILIGANYGTPTIARMVERSNASIKNVLQQDSQDRSRLEQYQQVLQVTVPSLIHNKLLGKRCAIVQTGDYQDGVTAASDAIIQAGGVVVSTTSLTGRFDYISLLQQQQIEGQFQSPSVSPNSGASPADTSGGSNQPQSRQRDFSALTSDGSPGTDGDQSSLLKPIAQALRHGVLGHPELQANLAVLVEYGLISTAGDVRQPVDAVVIVGGQSTENAQVSSDNDSDAQALAQQLSSNEAGAQTITIVGCETYGANLSSVSTFQRCGISSVDCIDEPIGALDLVYALRGEMASFGRKNTADELVPSDVEDSNEPSA